MMGAGLLMTVKSQLQKIYPYDKVSLNKKDSHDEYIYYKVLEKNGLEYDVRVEADNEDHDWWVEEYYGGGWNREHIISI